MVRHDFRLSAMVARCHGEVRHKGFITMPAARRSTTPRARQVLSACVLALAGCAPGSDLPPVPPAYAGPYLLGPGDDVRIITFGDTTLSGNFAVDESGHISMPLLGPVKAGGLTTDALQAEVIEELRNRKLFNAPSPGDTPTER